MYFKYYSLSPITRQNMRHYCMGFALQSPSALKDYVIHDNSVGADALSKLGSERANVPLGVFVHELHHPSVNLSGQTTTDSTTTATSQEVKMVEEDWRTPFIDFIKEFKLPPGVELDNTEAARIVRYSKGYAVVGDSLYKRSASGILMKCVSTEKGRAII
jgi:hypothetical protein